MVTSLVAFQLRWEGEDIKCMGCKISKPYVLWRLSRRVALGGLHGYFSFLQYDATCNGMGEKIMKEVIDVHPNG